MCVHVCVYMYVPMVSVKLALGEGGEREPWEVFPTGAGIGAGTLYVCLIVLLVELCFARPLTSIQPTELY